MYNKSKSYILVATLFVAIGFLTTAARSSFLPVSPSNERVLDSGLTVTVTSSTSVDLSWTGWLGPNNYRVTVLNLTTSQVEQQFTTPSTSTSVNSLTPGNTYRLSVDKAGYVITEDIIM